MQNEAITGERAAELLKNAQLWLYMQAPRNFSGQHYLWSKAPALKQAIDTLERAQGKVLRILHTSKQQ
jgi:hypothetical protein